MDKGILVSGRWIQTSESFEVRAPFSGELLANVSVADRSITEQAITAAAAAAEKMRHRARFEIAEALRGMSDGIKHRREEFVKTIALEAAKPVVFARGEVDRAIATFMWAAGEAERFVGEVVPIDTQAGGRGKSGVTMHRPRGVVFGITPFNFPLNLVAHKIAPALASGNAIIIKPSPRTPLTALLLGEVFLETRLPAAALQILTLPVEDLQNVFDDPRVAMISFTGSADVGWEIKKRAGKKAVALELGGNASVIVDETADIAAAVRKVGVGAFAYSGQVCISVQRAFVHTSVFDEFIGQMIDDARRLATGDPLNENTRLSVMIDEAAAKRAESWISQAIGAGAISLLESQRHGAMLTPAVVSNTDPEMRIVAEEAFAPVLVAEKFESIGDAIAAANNTRYGLQAGVFSNSSEIIRMAASELACGGVIINDVPTFRVDNMPYGGMRDSGFGREGVRYAMKEMCETKLIVY